MDPALDRFHLRGGIFDDLQGCFQPLDGILEVLVSFPGRCRFLRPIGFFPAEHLPMNDEAAVTAFPRLNIDKIEPEIFGHSRDARSGFGNLTTRVDISDLEPLDVTKQVFDLKTGDAPSEILHGNVFNLMRFIEDHRTVIRQNLSPFIATQSEIGEEEMMIDDDDLGIERILPRPGDKALIEARTTLAEANIRTSIDVPPQGNVIRQLS